MSLVVSKIREGAGIATIVILRSWGNLKLGKFVGIEGFTWLEIVSEVFHLCCIKRVAGQHECSEDG